MQSKKIFGIILCVLFLLFVCVAVFVVLFKSTREYGFKIWKSILISVLPFVGTAILIGMSWLIAYFVAD